MPLHLPGRGVFYHAVKCGGTFTRDVLIAHADARYVAGGHDPVHLRRPEDPPSVALEALDLPRLAVIRDPWTWYGSLYRYAVRGSNHNALRAWGNGSMEWRDVLWGWTHPWDVRGSVTPEDLGVIFEPVRAAEERATMVRVGLGLWSWAMAYFYSGLPVEDALERRHAPLAGVTRPGTGARSADTLLDASAPGGLAPQLAAYLGLTVEQVEAPSPAGHGRPNRNRTNRESVPTSYDERLESWVWEADGVLAATLGYRVP